MENDTTENARRELLGAINVEPKERAALEATPWSGVEHHRAGARLRGNRIPRAVRGGQKEKRRGAGQSHVSAHAALLLPLLARMMNLQAGAGLNNAPAF